MKYFVHESVKACPFLGCTEIYCGNIYHTKKNICWGRKNSHCDSNLPRWNNVSMQSL